MWHHRNMDTRTTTTARSAVRAGTEDAAWCEGSNKYALPTLGQGVGPSFPWKGVGVFSKSEGLRFSGLKLAFFLGVRVGPSGQVWPFLPGVGVGPPSRGWPGSDPKGKGEARPKKGRRGTPGPA